MKLRLDNTTAVAYIKQPREYSLTQSCLVDTRSMEMVSSMQRFDICGIPPRHLERSGGTFRQFSNLCGFERLETTTTTNTALSQRQGDRSLCVKAKAHFPLTYFAAANYLVVLSCRQSKVKQKMKIFTERLDQQNKYLQRRMNVKNYFYVKIFRRRRRNDEVENGLNAPATTMATTLCELAPGPLCSGHGRIFNRLGPTERLRVPTIQSHSKDFNERDKRQCELTASSTSGGHSSYDSQSSTQYFSAPLKLF